MKLSDSLFEKVDAAQAYYLEFQSKKHRYNVVDKFEPTDFKKKTPGGIMGHRYFDIEAVSGRRLHVDAQGLLAANVLNGRTYD